MKPIVVLVAAALGGLAVRRRKSFRGDLDKVTTAAKSMPSTVKARVGGGDTDAEAGSQADADAVTSDSGAPESSDTPGAPVAAGTA